MSSTECLMEDTPTQENVFKEGLRSQRTTSPCVIVLFGATGDLTKRKLVPALYNQVRNGYLSPEIAIVGFARREKSHEEFRKDLLEGIREHSPYYTEGDPVWQKLSESIFYHQSSFEDTSGYQSLSLELDQLDRELGTKGNRLFYLATAPEYFSLIAKKLGEADLSQPKGLKAGADPGGKGGPWVRIVVEKPFGVDLDSAVKLNQKFLDVFHESQVYRIDHYLGKETVQNILAFRFSNGIFEPLWNHKYVDHVQITVAESLGVGGRGPYYDQAGAVRDMVQNHMLQLLSLVAMEPPVSLDADAVRDEKVKVLRAIREIPKEQIKDLTVRAQYGEGSILGEVVPGYRQEDRVPEATITPTYAAFKVEIDSWRWAGVPFLLRHGKRLPKRATEIAIQFKKPPMPLFSESTVDTVHANTLIMNVQPDEGISLCFGSKVPGPDIRIRNVKMDFRYGHSFGMASPDAYERLLLDAIIGDSTLFTRKDEVEHSWRFFTPILEEWEAMGEEGLQFYEAGKWGPEKAKDLLGSEGRAWRKL